MGEGGGEEAWEEDSCRNHDALVVAGPCVDQDRDHGAAWVWVHAFSSPSSVGDAMEVE